ncbi:MAG: hypothetical protein BWY78_00237 [Alphaproteobacteria bacterium ADurb.Bin438]|nr:MAG: hypothetical protein BWY78_00237 [Alphaproteobacteria bacterium ADurb.Bin438]
MNNKIKYNLKHSFFCLMFVYDIIILLVLILVFFNTFVLSNYEATKAYEHNYGAIEVTTFYWRSSIHYAFDLIIRALLFLTGLYFAIKERKKRIYISYICLALPYLIMRILDETINYLVVNNIL